MTELDLPVGLPEEVREIYAGYLRRPQLTRELLIARVRKYLEEVGQACQADVTLDIDTSSDLGLRFLRLLRECDDEHLRHAQAAVYYFVESEDAEPDLSSPLGFDDDACVFNAVCAHLGMPDLKVDLL